MNSTDPKPPKRQLKVLSASQFERFACPRRGVLEYVHGFKQPPTDSLLLGTRVHQEAEEYLSGRGPMRLTEYAIFEPAIPLIPKPGTCETERAITFATANSPWRGAIDYLYWDKDHQVIGDFKTTKSVKYRKTERELKANVQANLYAYWAFQQNSSKKRGEWVYLSTGPTRGAHVTHVDFDRSEVEDYVGRVDERAAMIQGLLAAEPQGEEVETDTTKCFEYGKTCHHRLEGRCIIKAQEQSFGTRSDSMGESILDRIKRQKTEKATLWATATGDSEAEFRHPAEPPAGSLARDPGEPEAGFINPPEGASPRNPPEGQQIDMKKFDAIDEGLKSLAAEEKERAAEVDERAQLKSECVRLGLCEPNSRLRIDALKKLLAGKKDLDFDAYEDVVAPTAEEVESIINEKIYGPSANAPAISEPVPSMQRLAKAIGVLYVDCLPNTAVTDAHMVVSSFLPEVLAQVGEPHLKFVAYGKGTAALAVAIQKHFSGANYADMFADSRTIDADVLAVLVRNAETVVRGLR